MAVDQQAHSPPRTGEWSGGCRPRSSATSSWRSVWPHSSGRASATSTASTSTNGSTFTASEYIWDHLPGGLVDQIPFWDRGAQRLYSTLLAPLWGPLPTSTAYTSAHVLNVILLVSAIVPTALLARLVIDAPALRVLAVALGTVVPWLIIGSHLLTENLAFPPVHVGDLRDRPLRAGAVARGAGRRARRDRGADAVPAESRGS